MMRLKEYVGQFKLKRVERRVDLPALMFPGALSGPKHVLVCLPGGLRELTIVKGFLPQISELFRPADITLLSLPGMKVTDIFPRKGFHILSPSADQLTWSGLPRKSYVKTLQDYGFDLLLDLNLQPSPFTCGVLLSFPQAVRIGRSNHLGRPYYNLEVKTKYLRDERNIYRSVLETLSIIRSRDRLPSRDKHG